MGLNDDVNDRLKKVRERIATAATRSGRTETEVTIVAVTKGFSAEVVRAALDVGLTNLGENRAQEFKQKAQLFGSEPTWHFIGHLQTNKAKNVTTTATLIHSVDRLGLGTTIGRLASSQDLTQGILLEVNVTGEASKHGIPLGRARSLALELDAIEGLEVRGLMTMAPKDPDERTLRAAFADLRDLRDDLRSDLDAAVELSIGMSGDYEVAIEEGATMVRLGQALFGPRPR